MKLPMTDAKENGRLRYSRWNDRQRMKGRIQRGSAERPKLLALDAKDDGTQSRAVGSYPAKLPEGGSEFLCDS